RRPDLRGAPGLPMQRIDRAQRLRESAGAAASWAALRPVWLLHCGDLPARLTEEDCRSGEVEATGGLIIDDVASDLIGVEGPSHLHRPVRGQILGLEAIDLGGDVCGVGIDVGPQRSPRQDLGPLQQRRWYLELLLPQAVSDAASQRTGDPDADEDQDECDHDPAEEHRGRSPVVVNGLDLAARSLLAFDLAAVIRLLRVSV